MSESKPAYRGRIKYDEKTARKYQVRKTGKHTAEMRMVDRAFALIPKQSRVLDVPCGGGRVSIHLAQQGYRMAAADLSDSMIRVASENIRQAGLNIPVGKQDVEHLNMADRSFDAVISFRLFHHFPNADIRARVVRELCRVADQFVALSYFSPVSWTSARRKLRAATGGKKSDKHATPLAEVESYFAAQNFRLVKDFAQLPVLHTLHLALFQRAKDAGQ